MKTEEVGVDGESDGDGEVVTKVLAGDSLVDLVDVDRATNSQNQKRSINEDQNTIEERLLKLTFEVSSAFDPAAVSAQKEDKEDQDGGHKDDRCDGARIDDCV